MNQILVLILLVFMFPGSLLAEDITKEQGDAILKELKAIRQELNQIKKRVWFRRAGLNPHALKRPMFPPWAIPFWMTCMHR